MFYCRTWYDSSAIQVDMRNIKLFLASANSLKKDRDEVMLFLANKNQFLVKHGVFLELVRWEFLSSSFSETRKQDDFNNELKTSDIFTCLIFDRIGKYTKEEFDTAYQNYKEGKNPRKFYLFFKELPKGKTVQVDDIILLRAKIESDEQIYRDYKNPDQLKVFLNQNLDQDLPEILTATLQDWIQREENIPLTPIVPDYILDNLDEADKMLNKKLIRDAKEVYEDSLKQISKRSNPLLFAKIKRNLAKCFIDLAGESENEEGQIQKAILYLDEAKELFDSSKHPDDLIQTLLYTAEGFHWLSFFREMGENITKAIACTNQAKEMLKNSSNTTLYHYALYHLGGLYRTLTGLTHLDMDAKVGLESLTKARKLVDPAKDPLLCSYIHQSLAQIYMVMRTESTDQKRLDEYADLILDHCKKALEHTSIEKNPKQYANILSTKANVLHNLSCETMDDKLLTSSIELYKESINIYQKYHHSVNYITFNFQLASCLFDKFHMTGNVDDLEDGKLTINDAYKICSIESHPYYFACFKFLESKYYWTKTTKMDTTEEKKFHINTAINSLRSSLTIFTEDKYRFNYLKSMSQLSKLYFALYNLTNDPRDHEMTVSLVKEGLELYKKDLVRKDAVYDEFISLLSKCVNKKRGV